MAEPPDSPASALQEFAKRAKSVLSPISRALRRVSLFREALQLERFQNELGRVVALFMDDTKPILLDDKPEDSGPPTGQAGDEP